MASYVDENGIAYQKSSSGYSIPIARTLNGSSRALQGFKVQTEYGDFSYGDQPPDTPTPTASEPFPTWGYVAIAVGGATILWFLFGSKKK